MDLLRTKVIDFSKICRVTSSVGFFYPIPQLWTSYKSGQTCQLPTFTYLLIALREVAWIVYGRRVGNPTIFYLSVFGTTMYSCYSTMMLILKKYYYRIFIFYFLMIIEIAVLLHITINFQGSIAVFLQVTGSLMNIELIMRGIKQYNGGVFNKTSLTLVLINGFCWCIYSIQLLDIFIIIPTYLDTTINIIQISLYALLPHTIVKTIDDLKV